MIGTRLRVVDRYQFVRRGTNTREIVFPLLVARWCSMPYIDVEVLTIGSIKFNQKLVLKRYLVPDFGILLRKITTYDLAGRDSDRLLDRRAIKRLNAGDIVRL